MDIKTWITNQLNRKVIAFALVLATILVYTAYLHVRTSQLNSKIDKQTAVIQQILEGNLPVVEVDGQMVSLVSYFNQRLINLEPKIGAFEVPTPEVTPEATPETPEPTE